MSDSLKDNIRRRNEVRNKIRSGCEEDFCPSWVTQNVKDEVWYKAWEHGHSNGEDEVRYYYDDFMDIVKAMGPGGEQ